MARMTIYVPDDLRDQAKAAGLNVSKLTQAAIRAALGFLPDPTTAPGPHPIEAKQATCPHPRGERTSYGLCRRCGAVVVP